MKVPVTQNDDTLLRFRKFITYDPCTKKFEKKKRENENLKKCLVKCFCLFFFEFF